MADARRPPPAPRKLDRGIRPKLVPIPPFNTYPREEAIKYLRNIFNTFLINYFKFGYVSFADRNYFIKEYDNYKHMLSSILNSLPQDVYKVHINKIHKLMVENYISEEELLHILLSYIKETYPQWEVWVEKDDEKALPVDLDEVVAYTKTHLQGDSIGPLRGKISREPGRVGGRKKKYKKKVKVKKVKKTRKVKKNRRTSRRKKTKKRK